MIVTASAPGSFMVTGEHAVVAGAPALVAAYDQRVTVTAELRATDTVTLVSDIAPVFEAKLCDLEAKGPYRFVIAAIKATGASLGMHVAIRSDIDPTLGLGSSAAVTVAVLGVLDRALDTHLDIHAQALAVVRGIQGRGGGADLGAALTGGLLAYQLGEDGKSAAIDLMPTPPPMALKYVGYKTPTGEVLAHVAALAEKSPRYYARIYEEMRLSAEAGCAAARGGDWRALAETLNGYQKLMVELGVSNDALEALVSRGRATAPAAKISGSGLGDCVLAFGAVPPGWTEARLAKKGLVFHD